MGEPGPDTSGGTGEDEQPDDGPAGTPTGARPPDELPEAETEDSAVERAARETPPGLPLRVIDLEKSFGGITAVDGVTFDVEEGSLTGLIGPNGAGKSTTFDLVTGVQPPDGGTVLFQGEDITGMRTHRVATRGLVRTFQIARQLEEMTVLENLMLSPGGQLGESLWRSVLPGVRGRVVDQEMALSERAWEMLERFELDHLADAHAGTLSGGQRKLMEMARAMMTDPDMLLLDEPFAGVNPTLEDALLDRIHDLRASGYTFLLVEHDVDLILDNCERVIVMHRGQVIATGDPETISEDEAVLDAYLGGTI